MNTNFGKLYLNTALIVLLAAVVAGCLAGASYIWPGFLKDSLGFISMRPIHASAALFWVLLGATSCVYLALQNIFPNKINKPLAWAQWALWIIALIGIFTSYFLGQFGGREYWEYNPIFSLPIALAWILFIIQFFKIAFGVAKWPVYMWMWMTGIVFFMFTFLEGYLWLFPYFRQELITDMTIQWKVNGSMVGSWNQILYGSSFFLMDKISGNKTVGHSKLAFAMYFLGFFNLCFNWGHHIYSLPTEPYIRYFGYVVSMTEWIIFAKIIYNWRTDVDEAHRFFSYFPYRFIMAANIWVLLNLFLALLMSIPAFNLYTHGTHVTVAHSMGTTIGINSMIILAAAFMFYSNSTHPLKNEKPWTNRFFWLLQGGLFILWIGLIGAGIKKGLWQLTPKHSSYGDMMATMKPWFGAFYLGGLLLTIAFIGIAIQLLRAHFNNKNNDSTLEIDCVQTTQTYA
ncbi:MAG: cytochrome C oxidase subunit I [Bacteroidetes bacterium B1(2017)]|nr:MAG: cytochrome C oxidase subunit I [Bacteroidetes bacterium B1(2017)]